MKAKRIDTGKVIIQVIIILCAVVHLTPLTRCDEPTPKIDEDTTCVVDTGK